MCPSKALGLDSNERQINTGRKDHSCPCELYGYLESHAFRALSASPMFSVQPYKETATHWRKIHEWAGVWDNLSLSVYVSSWSLVIEPQSMKFNILFNISVVNNKNIQICSHYPQEHTNCLSLAKFSSLNNFPWQWVLQLFINILYVYHLNYTEHAGTLLYSLSLLNFPGYGKFSKTQWEFLAPSRENQTGIFDKPSHLLSFYAVTWNLGVAINTYLLCSRLVFMLWLPL